MVDFMSWLLNFYFLTFFTLIFLKEDNLRFINLSFTVLLYFIF